MNKKPLSSCSRVLGFIPQGTESFVLVNSEVLPLSADMPGFFQGNGVQIDFDGGELKGALSLWLTLTDAKTLAAHLTQVIDEVDSWREAQT
ncbi:MAG: hypothetical protein ACHQ50_13330 [Fimbriimonadales bacterium]